VFIASRGDVAMHGNLITTKRPFGAEPMLIDTVVWGLSTNVTGNRFNDSPSTPDDIAFSAVTVGWMNTTAHNQGTRCIAPFVLPAASTLIVDGPNLELVTTGCAEGTVGIAEGLGIIDGG
jgi:hypothetical protein